jgi:hypothetical protein
MAIHPKSTLIVTVNAVWFIAVGIFFTLYAPLVVAFFGAVDLPEGNILLYWHMVSFARLFGGALLGAGLLTWALRPLMGTIVPLSENGRGLLSALLITNLILLFVTVTQQSAVWQTPLGWVLALSFLCLTLAYAFLLLYKPRGNEITTR